MKKPIILGVIPARYSSTRLPGKPLAFINGLSMIERVYNQCKKAKFLDYVCVATDDDRIQKHVIDFGGESFITSKKHKSGTDRCLEALNLFVSKNKQVIPDIVINIQGDEPLIDPLNIDKLSETFSDSSVDIATLGTIFKDINSINDNNSVKIVKSLDNDALYFSRTPIPFIREENNCPKKTYNYLKHIGIYAFRAQVLKEICSFPPSSLEIAECLEQLRWLENGYKIRVVECNSEGLCVDTREDLKKIENFIIKNNI